MRILIASIILSICILVSSYLNITSNITALTNVSVSETVVASLPVSSVFFGTMLLGDTDNTEDGSPPPFIIQNDGNVLINVTINATQMWSGTGATGTSGYYQFKTAENESGSVYNVGSDLVTTWTNIPIYDTVVKAVDRLDYNDSRDTVKIHINLTVPDDEPAGDKSSTITLTVGQA